MARQRFPLNDVFGDDDGSDHDVVDDDNDNDLGGDGDALDHHGGVDNSLVAS